MGMNITLLIGLGAGLASAILFLSTATGSLLAMMLFLVIALPGFIVGLGWGSATALIAGLTASVLSAVIIGPAAGAVYLATLALPIVLLCYLALLARPGAPEAAGKPASVEWYPPGRLVAWATLLAGGVSALSIPMLGLDAETYRNTAKSYFDATILAQWPEGTPNVPDKKALEPLINLMVVLLPATSAMVWLGVMLTNLWAGAKIAEASGRSIRPCPDLAEMTYPSQFPLGFVAALLFTFAPGILGIFATGFAGAYLFSYILMGLVVLHVVARRSAFPGFMLGILYMAMLLIGWVSLLVAVIGLGEPVLKLRQRAFNKHQPPGQPGQ